MNMESDRIEKVGGGGEEQPRNSIMERYRRGFTHGDNGKAKGSNSISVEASKVFGEAKCDVLLKILKTEVDTETMPEEWSTLIPVFKRKEGPGVQ